MDPNIFVKKENKTCSRENLFLCKEWQVQHLKNIEKLAGPRYSPELNIELPISEIFNGLSRTAKFYHDIRRYYGNLQREFCHLTKEYLNEEIKSSYEEFKCIVDSLLNALSVIKKYNKQKINWQVISNLTKEAGDALYKLIDFYQESEKIEQDNHQKYSINTQMSFCYKVQKELKNIDELSSSLKAQLSNKPFLFLTGSAGIGKTHLLCDIVKHRINNSLPTILVFGELFDSEEPPLDQIIRTLNLKLDKKQFLEKLNSAGKKSNCRAVVFIDAINETPHRDFWKKYLKITTNEIKKYHNIALVISIRKGFENEVNENALNEFLREEHLGFNFMEWKAIDVFFKNYNLPLPEVPLLMPEFQNPLFLQLFCKAFNIRIKKNKKKKENKQIFRGHEGTTYIFESFVDNVAEKISNKFKILNREPDDIWNNVIKKIAESMVKINNTKISEEKVFDLLKKAYPTVDCYALAVELERNLLIEKIPHYSVKNNKYEGFDFKFPFQKFSEHLIARYYFKKFADEFSNNKDLINVKKFFSKRRKLGKNLIDSWSGNGLIESFSIQCPERFNGYELIEIAPYLKTSYDAKEAFIESLIWRKPKAFPQNIQKTLDFIHDIVRPEYLQHKLLNAIISVAQVADHPFNANFLHECLSKESMASRDSWWTIFLHKQYGKKGAVDRLIEWTLSGQDTKKIEGDSILLCSVALCWFLTSTNRTLRDKATKGLIAILVNRLPIVLELLEKFKEINDFYISERLYAVAYGCVIHSKQSAINDFENLAKWIFKEVFEQGNPPIHVLLRDYACSIIEFTLIKYQNIKIHQSLIPPFSTQWINYYPENQIIKLYQEADGERGYLSPINLIIDSMQPEFSEINHYGNFGRYTFQNSLAHFDFKGHTTIQNISNWAVKYIFDDIGYNKKLHGEFDQELHQTVHAFGRGVQSERIGKKYQWISLHILLALFSDHFKIIDYDKKISYLGPWQCDARDIDPTFLSNNSPKEVPSFESNDITSDIFLNNKEIDESRWVKNTKNMPDPKKMITLVDSEQKEWLLLSGHFSWSKSLPPEYAEYENPTPTLFYRIKSFLIKTENAEQIFHKMKKRNFNFFQDLTHKNQEFNHTMTYLGEYPWAKSYQTFKEDYDWFDTINGVEISEKILMTDIMYNNIETDKSFERTSQAIHLDLPTEFIINEMNLSHHYIDGRFFDQKLNLITFDPSIFNRKFPTSLLISKKEFLEFLHSYGYTILWGLYGEKYIVSQKANNKFIRSDIKGLYLMKNNKIIGKKCLEER